MSKERAFPSVAIDDRACRRCALPASHKQGRLDLCPKHYRIGQMRAGAKRNGKAVPTLQQMDAIIPDDMICQDCSRVMNWLGRDNQTFVATLQHYRDGSFGIVCRSCNTRHAFMPSDIFRDQQMTDFKFCPRCEKAKTLDGFAHDHGRSGSIKRKSWCKECSHTSHTSWRVKNAEYYNAYQRASRLRRKHVADAMMAEREERIET